jgi:hypothetical protein
MMTKFGNFGYYQIVAYDATQWDLRNMDAHSFKLCIGGTFIFKFACVHLELNYEFRVLKFLMLLSFNF